MAGNPEEMPNGRATGKTRSGEHQHRASKPESRQRKSSSETLLGGTAEGDGALVGPRGVVLRHLLLHHAHDVGGQPLHPAPILPDLPEHPRRGGVTEPREPGARQRVRSLPDLRLEPRQLRRHRRREWWRWRRLLARRRLHRPSGWSSRAGREHVPWQLSCACASGERSSGFFFGSDQIKSNTGGRSVTRFREAGFVAASQ